MMSFIHAVKFGDPVCIRACHKIFVLFFFCHGGNSSKYAPSIMNTLADYDMASERDKMIIDLFSSINCYGQKGAGVPGDMVCEWKVKNVKSLESRYASNYEASLAKRTVLAANTISDVKSNYFESLLIDDPTQKGGHSTQIIKEDQKKSIR